jgi:hypothetical protein
MSNSRRGFLGVAAGVAGAAAAAAQVPGAATGPLKFGRVAPQLPAVKFGNTEVTRLIVGSNPFHGYSHFNSILDQSMREFMTQERRLDTLARCEQEGINTWQLHYNWQTIADWRLMRDRGGKLNWFLLTDFDMHKDFSLIPPVARLGPIGIAHHGNRTDEAYRSGDMSRVQEFCKRVRDSVVMVGISTHNPAVVDFIESKGWDVDYFQCCLYNVSRSREEARALMNGEAPLGETFLEKDPERMCKMIRATKKPVLAFKALGAGRVGYSREQVTAAFKFVYQNIKPSDAVIVGMWPKFKDEPKENAEVVRSLLA